MGQLVVMCLVAAGSSFQAFLCVCIQPLSFLIFSYCIPSGWQWCFYSCALSPVLCRAIQCSGVLLLRLEGVPLSSLTKSSLWIRYTVSCGDCSPQLSSCVGIPYSLLGADLSSVGSCFSSPYERFFVTWNKLQYSFQIRNSARSHANSLVGLVLLFHRHTAKRNISHILQSFPFLLTYCTRQANLLYIIGLSTNCTTMTHFSKLSRFRNNVNRASWSEKKIFMIYTTFY